MSNARVNTAAKRRQLEGLERAREASLAARRQSNPDRLKSKARLRGPRRLRPIHHDIARRVVMGQTHRQIAGELGMSEAHVNVICRTPIFEERVTELQKELEGRFVQSFDKVQQRLIDEQLQSVETLVTLRDDGDKDEVRLRAAQAILKSQGNDMPKDKARESTPLTNDIAMAIAVAIKDVQVYVQSKQKAESDG